MIFENDKEVCGDHHLGGYMAKGFTLIPTPKTRSRSHNAHKTP